MPPSQMHSGSESPFSFFTLRSALVGSTFLAFVLVDVAVAVVPLVSRQPPANSQLLGLLHLLSEVLALIVVECRLFLLVGNMRNEGLVVHQLFGFDREGVVQAIGLVDHLLVLLKRQLVFFQAVEEASCGILIIGTNVDGNFSSNIMRDVDVVTVGNSGDRLG